MQFPVLVFIKNISDLTPSIWTSNWGTLTQFWNDHDQGVRPWTSITFGTVCIQKSSSYTLTAADQVVLANSTSAILTITLPTAIGINGRRYTVKDWKGTSATNNITVATTSSQTIDGSTTQVLSTNYQAIEVASDGANWSIISKK